MGARHLFPGRLRARLLLLLLLAVLPPMLVLGGAALEQRRHAEAHARDEARDLARVAALRHRHALAVARETVLGLARLRAVRERNAAACRELLPAVLDGAPAVAALAVADPDGRVVAMAGAFPAGSVLSAHRWFDRARLGATLGPPLAARDADEVPALVVAAPARGADGAARALVVLLLRLDWPAATGDEQRLPPGGALTVFDGDGVVLARHPALAGASGRRIAGHPLVRAARAAGSGVIATPGLDGVMRLMAFEPLEGPPERPLWAAAGVSLERAYAPSRRAFERSLALLALFATGLLLLGWHGLRLAVLRRLEALLGAARRVTAGEAGARAGPPYGRGELGELARAFDTMLDAQARRAHDHDRATRALRESEALRGAVFESAPDALVTIDARGHIQDCNAAAERLLGLARHEARGHDLIGLALPPELRDTVRRELAVWARDAGAPSGQAPYETRVRALDGREVPARVTFARIAADGAPVRFSVHVRDLSGEHRLLEALQAMSLVDDLSGLCNRRGLLALGRQQLRQALRDRTPVLLLFADLDRLKAINDAFGHAAGDEAIREAAQALREVFRASDVLARVGGDEFAVLAPDPAGGGGAAVVARLHERVAARNRSPGRRWSLELSVGVARWDPARPCTVEDLLAEGDALMYQHKRERRMDRAG